MLLKKFFKPKNQKKKIEKKIIVCKYSPRKVDDSDNINIGVNETIKMQISYMCQQKKMWQVH